MALDLFCCFNSDGSIFYHEPNSGDPVRVSVGGDGGTACWLGRAWHGLGWFRIIF
jgi:hypothetical protein